SAHADRALRTHPSPHIRSSMARPARSCVCFAFGSRRPSPSNPSISSHSFIDGTPGTVVRLLRLRLTQTEPFGPIHLLTFVRRWHARHGRASASPSAHADRALRT